MLRSRLEMGFGTMMAACAGWASRNAALVLCTLLVSATAAGTYSYQTLKLDLDATRLISDTASFRMEARDIVAAFPAVEGSMSAVVQADDPMVARQTADRLAAAFRDKPDLFSEVFAPGIGPFYDQNALLLLTAPEIQAVATKLQRSMPLMQILSRQPDLVGLATGLDQLAIAARMKIFPPEAITLLTEIDRVGQSLIDGKPAVLDWQSTLVGDLNRNRQRWVVSVKPAGDKALAVARTLSVDPAITEGGLAKIVLVGGPAGKAVAGDATTRGLMTILLVAFGAVCLAAMLGLRSVRLFVTCLITLAISLALASAAATAILGSITLPGAALAVLFTGLAIDASLLVTLRFREERIGGRDPARALAVATRSSGLPLALCAISMATAFLAFLATNLRGIGDLGLVITVALTILWLVATVAVPAMLTLLPIAPRRGTASSKILGIIAGVLTSQPVRILVTLPIIGAAAASLPLLPRVEFERDIHPIVQPMMGAAQVMVDGEQEAKNLQRKLEGLPEVGIVTSVFSFIPKGQDAKLSILSEVQASLPGGVEAAPQDGTEQIARNIFVQLDQALDGIAGSDAPDAAKAAAQTVAATLRKYTVRQGEGAAAINGLEAALIPGLAATTARIEAMSDASKISLDSLDPELRRRYVGPNNQYLIDIGARRDLSDRATLTAFANAVRSVAPTASGPAIDAVQTAGVLRHSLLIVLAVAGAAIGFLLLILLPRFYDVILVAVPVILALLMSGGAMALFHLPLIPIAIVAVPVLIGCGVGNGIKLIMRSRESVRYHSGVRPSTPRAIVWTSIANMAAAGAMFVAPVPGLAILATLVIGGLLLLTTCSFVVLPTLVHWTRPRPSR